MTSTIRTKAVELEAVPAIAYKQKLATGGAGIKLHRLDCAAAAAFTLDKRTGKATAYGKVDGKLFPEAAITEAIEVTAGLPYSSHSRIVIAAYAPVAQAAPAPAPVPAAEEIPREDEPSAETAALLAGKEYGAIIKEYVKENGKLDYARMNKEFIQFAAKSKTVADLAAKSAALDEILLFVVKNRAAYLSKNKEGLTDSQTAALIEVLDEIDPRNAFKELSAHIKRTLSKK
jgi:hypothetical protein